ncbi:MAG: EAL domain-containing protein [Gammaproteobacteria bacterium]|nr:EAL domain-containing protein [Gammaproteobacteria bacterium]MDH4315700.1 EAL domain-containing protein [Gammaproteobacteria bacterium]MDH5214442.1 EAL domain-containing protein [Gammaproteobacteria bacterium]MDH5500825.1 EAL domain-containing protein [Gammaproteobacteria bacterium]
MSKRSADHWNEDPKGITRESTGSPSRDRNLFGADVVRSADSECRSFTGHSVLMVSGDGLVVEVLQAPDHCDDTVSEALIGIPVDELWPGDVAERLLIQVRRAIRTRQVSSTEYTTNNESSHHDFVFIPQGRDRALLVSRDISERKTAFSRIEKLAYRDDTTKLPNRQYLIEELERCISILKLKEGRAAVLCLDVISADGQNSSSNSRLHDAIFVELASRLTHELRGANADGVDDYERYTVAARIEYSQFGVILPVINSGSDAEGVAKRLIEILQQPVRTPSHDARMRVRIGIALFPQDGVDAGTLFSNAIAAMDDARNSAASPYKLHSGTVRLRALQRRDLELELRTALDNDEFDVEYLPVVAADSRKVISVEALLRWPKNVFGPQSIQKVISIAENTGLILPIGDWVLQKGCEAIVRWRANGWTNPRLSVNLSVQEFSRSDLAARILEALGKHSIDPRCLDVEITEYTLFRDAMKGYSMCSELKALGIGIIVDDYGTGACSLAHVARSPVDAIKIDNSFVANAMADISDRAACAAITAMARSLNMKIIAEGVETKAQADMLVEQGCHALQGFFICKPTSSDGVQQFVAKEVAT